MVPSQEEPAAERETNEAQPPGPAPSDDAPLPGPGPSDVSDVAAEKVEVELTRSAGSEPPVPPEGGWGWLVMLAAMWCNGSVFGIQNAYGVLFVSMLDTFKAKDDDNMAFKTAWVGSLSILGHYFKKRLGLVNGIVTAGSSVFTILLPLLLGNLISSVKLFNTLRILCIFMFVLFLAGFTYRPLVPSTKEKESGGSRSSFFSRRKLSPPKKSL